MKIRTDLVPLVSLVLASLLIPACSSSSAQRIQVVTFNVGTTERLAHEGPPEDGYGRERARIADEYYGNSLAWSPAIEAVKRFFEDVRPDVVGFQEILGENDCALIPLEARVGFVCETWSPGDPSVASQVLGRHYQVACHRGKADQCLAVRRSFGNIRGCAGDLCPDHLDGQKIDGCGGGARVGRAVVDRLSGEPLTVVHLHATSGAKPQDEACRMAQITQIFVDLGDGEPAANGERNVILGDFNVDPHRGLPSQPSAQHLRRFVGLAGESRRFTFVSAAGPGAPGGYQDRSDIDHVISDRFRGECWIAGVGDRPPVLEKAVYFDHRPVVCSLEVGG